MKNPLAHEIPVSEFRIENVPRGTKKRFHLVVDRLPGGQPVIFPTLVARGSARGKTLLVTGCVHGDEFEGPVAVQDVFDELDVQAMRGTFVAIPVLNGPAFTAGTREGGWDHQNLARIFPGRSDGTISERIADAFHQHVVGEADFYVDIHAAGNLYSITRFAGYQVLPGDLGRAQKAGAIAFGLDLVWGTTALPGRSLSTARERAVPAIYVEMTGEGRCRPADLELTRQGVRNALAFLGILESEYPTAEPAYCFETVGEDAGHLQVQNTSPTSGIFVPAVEVWQEVTEGDRLGAVRHPDGTVLAEIRADRCGRVLFMRTFPRVFSGEPLAFVIALPDGARR